MIRKPLAVSLLIVTVGLSACSGARESGSEDVAESGSGSSGPGSGAGGLFGTGGGPGSSGNGGDSATCASATAVAEVEEAPADIIWIVDQSGSMGQETDYVQQKINDFATLIEKSGVDYHVVMIADPDDGNAICVPPPLAGPNCGDAARFRLVPTEVGSNDGPQIAIESYAAYADFLRPEATKHFVFVTDDNSDLSAAEFTQQVLALQPAGMFEGFKVHAIYAYGSGGNGCDGPFGSGAADGTVYTELVAQTKGAAGVICTGDWALVFDEITKAVLAGAKVPCEMDIPDPPDGETLDPNLVNVHYQSGMGMKNPILRVDSAADCGSAGGWYYDDNAAPKTISLCPGTCDTVQTDPEAKLEIEFGCQSVFQTN